MKSPISLINSAILVVYFALATVTPLIFTTQTTELYEVPKMFFVYFAATAIFFLTLIKITLERKLEFPKSKPLYAFIALTIVYLLSTFLSTDRYTSVFGFTTRLNGGLLSQIAYLVIFAGALINLSAEKAKSILLALIVGAVAVSLWGIPSHFNKDPTCYVLTKELTSNCWQVGFNPTVRMFSTLGQPNWLASYLVLILPFSLAFLLLFKNRNTKLFFALSSALIFWAIILTNSRSGLLGLAISAAVFTILAGTKTLKSNQKWAIALLAIFVSLTLIYADPINWRIKELAAIKKKQGTSAQNQVASPLPDQSSPTESGQIRLVVWRGAIKVLSTNPILGTGPETFVSTYYLTRPDEHNKTSEWEFFYNKVHNEFLNYLANTGLLGLGAFLIFLLLTFRELLFKLKPEVSSPNRLMAKAAVAALLGYLTTIFFGFSTVATQVAMFLIIPATLLTVKNQNKLAIKPSFLGNSLYQKITLIALLLLGIYCFTLVFRLTFANVLEKLASKSQSPAKQITAYTNSIKVSPVNSPYLASDFGYDLATFATLTLNSQNKQSLIKESVAQTKSALKLSPNNYLITQRAAKTYALLIALGPQYAPDGLELGRKLTKMAPNYPISYLTLAKIQISAEKYEDAKLSIQKVLSLKPDYLEARQMLDEVNLNLLSRD